MKSILVKAYAKINLALNIEGMLDEKYHKVDMILCPITLHDTIEIELLPKGSKETYITSDNFDFNEIRNNICHEVVVALREKFKFKNQFRIHIYKRIPVAGGLAGGSADAAAVLKGIVKLLNLPATEDDLLEISKKLGSDMSYCLYNKMARCTNRGEELQFIDSKFKNYILIVKPEHGLNTEKVYKECDKHKFINTDIDKMIKALEDGDNEQVYETMNNALMLPASKLLPEISDLLSLIKSKGYKNSQMTGSGSCIFVLDEQKRPLYKLMKELYELGYEVELCKVLN